MKMIFFSTHKILFNLLSKSQPQDYFLSIFLNAANFSINILMKYRKKTLVYVENIRLWQIILPEFPLSPSNRKISNA